MYISNLNTVDELARPKVRLHSSGGRVVGDIVAARPGPAPWIKPDDLITDVLERLEFDEVAALVVSSNGRRIRGIISERDVVRGMRYYGPEVFEIHAAILMQDNVITCDVSDSCEEALELMRRNRIRHLPVTDDDDLVGLVSMFDLLTACDRQPN